MSMRYNEDSDLSKLKAFDYSTEYADAPSSGEEIGIFDIGREVKDVWEEGEKEKKAYQSTFAKHVQNWFATEKKARKQSTLSENIMTKLLLMGGGAFVLTFFLVGKFLLILQSFGRDFKVQNSYGLFSVPYQLLTGNVAMLIFLVIVSLIVVYKVITWYLTKISRFDNRVEAKGSRPAYLNYDQPKCKEVFEIREIDEPVGVPIAVYRGMVYCMPDDPKHYQFRNKNMMYIGGSGSGKSYAGVEPNILQRIANRESFIVSDTKGALYKDLAACCEAMGFVVQMFSTKSFTRSDSWNCLYDIIHSPDDTAWDKIDDFAHTLIKNSKRNGEKGDQYWDNNEQDLLRACLHYVCRSKMYPDDNKRTFAALIDLINGSVEDIDQIFKSLPSNESAYDASASFRNLNNIDLKEKYRSGLANKLHTFKNPYVKAAMSYDGINIEDSVHRPTAIFLVSADDKETFDVVTSLFITNAYTKLIEIADSDNYNNGALYKPYWFILDEMCNMAAINDMSRKISTNRSRNINFVLTIQSISQIEERYGRLFENIAANCGTIIPVGVFDDTTAKFIANKCGTFSEVTKGDMTKKPTILSKYAIPLQKTERVQIVESKVLTEFNIKNSLNGDILALIAGKELFRGEPYGTDMHPLYKYCKTIGIDEREPEWFLQFKRENPDMNFESGSHYTPSEDYELTPIEVSYEPPKQEETGQSLRSKVRTNFNKLVGDDDTLDDISEEYVTTSELGAEPAGVDMYSSMGTSGPGMPGNTHKGYTVEDMPDEMPEVMSDEMSDGSLGSAPGSSDLASGDGNFDGESGTPQEYENAYKPKNNVENQEVSVYGVDGKPIKNSGSGKKKKTFTMQPIQSSNPPPQIQDEESINKAIPRKESSALEGAFPGYHSDEPENRSKSTREFYEEIGNATNPYSAADDFSDLESILDDEDM